MKTYEEYKEMTQHHGKFELLPPYAPYFWELAMDGDGETFTDMHGENPVTLFIANDIEIEIFGFGIGEHIIIWENEQGFVRQEVRGSRDSAIRVIEQLLGGTQ